MKKVILYNLKVTALVVVAYTIMLVLAFGGMLLSDRYMLSPVFGCISLVLTLAFIGVLVCNAIHSARLKKQYSDAEKEKALNDILDRKEEVLKNPSKYVIDCIGHYRKAISSVIAYIAAASVLMFAGGLGVETWIKADLPGTGFLVVIFIIFFLLVFCYAMMVVMIDHNLTSDRFQEEFYIDYETTYNFVKDIFVAEGIDKPVIVTIADRVNVSVKETEKFIYIELGTVVLRFLREDELKAVLYHEIGYIRNKDTYYTDTLKKYEKILEKLLPMQTYKLICPGFLKLEFDKAVINTVLNMACETKADEEVLKKNAGDAFAGAIVKLFGLQYAHNRAYIKMNYQAYKRGYWTSDLINMYFDLIREHFAAHADFYLYSANHHLDERITTHPNIKIRYDKFATHEPDMTLAQSSPFYEDIYRCVRQNICVSDRHSVFSSDIEAYGIRKYEKDRDSYLKEGRLPIRDSLELLKSAYDYGDYEIAVKVSEETLSIDEGNVRCHYILGMIYAFDEFSDKCIEHLKLVAGYKSCGLSFQAFCALGKYAVISGNSGLLDWYRSEVAVQMEDNETMQEAVSLRLNKAADPLLTSDRK